MTVPLNKDQQKPLCVDLDGTVIATDILLESFLILLKKNFLYVFLIPFWIMKGKIHFKRMLYLHSRPEAEALPYRDDVLKYIMQEREKGRKIILVTATLQEIASDIAGYLNLFDEAYGSFDNTNLKSGHKAEFLTNKFGRGNFDYIGDSNKDIPVWEAADKKILVSKSPGFSKSINNKFKIEKEFREKKNSLAAIIKEIRVYQWVKNILIFLPLFMAHEVTNPGKMIDSVLAFLAFSFAASSVYLLNDMLDIEADRLHPRKRFRPLASGELSVAAAVILFPILVAAGMILSFIFISSEFALVLILYLITTAAYSFHLKKVVILDILILAFLYTLRLIAGAVAANVDASHWLLAFSLFIFLSLAIVKRYTELKTMLESSKNNAAGRGYITDDISLLLGIGPASGLLAVLVLALYVHSDDVARLYLHPKVLWMIAPLLLYWITRIWFLAHRGRMHDDPIVFTVKDPVSYFVGIIVMILLIGASI